MPRSSCSSDPGGERRPLNGCSGRWSATTASTGCAPSSGTASTDETSRRLIAVAGDVGQDGLGLDDEGRRLLAMLRRGRPLGGDGQLRRPARPGGRGQPPRAHPGGGCAGRGMPRAGFRHPPPDLGLDRIRGRHPPGRGPGGAARREPLLPRRGLAGRGRRGTPGPRATCSPARGNAAAQGILACGPRGARRSRRPPAGRPLGAPPRGVGEGRDGPGGLGTGPVARVAGRLPLYQGPRRACAGRPPRTGVRP